MSLIDVHSHILSGMDDGAQDPGETLQLLTILKEQGVTDVIATPHFSPSEDSINEFWSKLTESKRELRRVWEGADLPNIYFGCEIFYSYGLGGLEGIKELTIENTKRVLIEFGIIRFDSMIIKDLIRIREDRGIIPIIAHIERYKYFKGYDKLLELVKNGYCEAQVNASSVVDNAFTKVAHKLIKKGYVSYIGSDCHSPVHRPPKIAEAYKIITEKFGRSTADALKRNGEKFLMEIKESR